VESQAGGHSEFWRDSNQNWRKQVRGGIQIVSTALVQVGLGSAEEFDLFGTGHLQSAPAGAGGITKLHRVGVYS
jgi:hypothetical protein